jgi:hypothetical protein
MSEEITETGAAEQPAPTAQQEAKADIGGLMSNKEFAADFSGANGRPAQVAAMAQKSQLHQQAYSDTTPEQGPPLPEAIQDGLDAQDDMSQAMAEALTPATSVEEFKFNLIGQNEMELTDLANVHATIADAAMSIGANNKFAKQTIEHVDATLARQDITPSDADGVVDAMNTQFGEQAHATVENAKAALARMEPNAQEMVKDALDGLDNHTAAWLVGRLARTYQANN